MQEDAHGHLGIALAVWRFGTPDSDAQLATLEEYGLTPPSSTCDVCHDPADIWLETNLLSLSFCLAHAGRLTEQLLRAVVHVCVEGSRT